MNASFRLVAPLVSAVVLSACSGGSSNIPGATSAPAAQRHSIAMPDWEAKGLARRACETSRRGEAQCLALIQSKGGLDPAIAGWAPADIEARYNLPSSTNGSGQIVAVVDALDEPNASSDLATYRNEFGLGTANFTKYNQTGQMQNYPVSCASRYGGGWCVEEDLDIEMVSAACPKCTIYLIEANSQNPSDLETAEAEAVTLGAHIISNSWYCNGVGCASPSYFESPGVEYLFASGDDGYGVYEEPAVFGSVVSVGGTVLSKSGSTYSETAWDGSGSDCATNIAKPSWQHDPDCTGRTEADISAVAWQLAEYDSNEGGWFTVGGTSAAAPINAGVFGLAGNASSQNAAEKFWTLKKHKYKKDLHDITSGSNGNCGNYLCIAGKGYDGPTGWGTPNGIGAY
ncbi:MAG: peptidase S8 [Candidatus Eremiobacteraeota bacterium]|nr:peptidase S8 [Candidatus Eremiobacteraeota bacterium]